MEADRARVRVGVLSKWLDGEGEIRGEEGMYEYVNGVNVRRNVMRAIKSKKIGVVALETSIVCHGLPFPENLHLARHLETMVRECGCEPAHVAVLRGVPTVGLGDGELEMLARGGKRIPKCSTRDVGYLAATRQHGGTTVSGTLSIIGHVPGIHVFATGGIGGVHRGGETSMDISADLVALGRATQTAVVCAGAKSLLDIPRTLEVLETQGVCVATLGSDKFPAFFVRDSGIASPRSFDSIDDAARATVAPLARGLLLCVPPEETAASRAAQEALEEALSHVATVRGSDVTPFVLGRTHERSGGKSVEANTALVKANVRVASQLAATIVATLGDTM